MDLNPGSISLARAAWDAATPGTRVLFYLRSKQAALAALDQAELNQLPFMAWDDLPTETAKIIAWDVQFLTRYLRDGQAALRAVATPSGQPLRDVA